MDEMKGYSIDSGYMGYLPDQRDYMLFSCERDYKEYYKTWYAN